MAKITFPNEDLHTLEALGAWINRQTDETTVEIRPGTYYGTLHLEGLQCPSLLLYAPSGATLTGCRRSCAQFKPCGGRLLAAPIGTGLCPERLKIDDEMKILARYPKRDPGALLNGTTDYADICRRIREEKDLSGAYLHSLHEHEWGSNDYRITGRKEKEPVLEWVGNNNRGSGFKKDCVYIENLPSLLTDPDEWYYDRESGFLYVTENPLSPGEQHVGILDQLCLLSIRDCTHTQITIKGIRFTDTDRNTFKSPWKRYLRSDWAFNRASAVDIHNSGNIQLIACKFDNLGSNAIGIFNECKDIHIDSCDFRDCLTNGILILGNPDSTYCTSSWEGSRHLTQMESPEQTGPSSEHYPRDVHIAGCHFYNLGTEDKQSAGVCISLALRVTVDRCTLHHLPRAAINICENAFGGHTISNCDLFDCVRETGDHGPFNSWGRDRFWALRDADDHTGKFGLQKKPYALADMLEPNTIRHNRVVGTRGFGIDLDDGSTNYLIEDNLCIGVGIKLREGFYRTVRNNVLIGAPLDLHATYAGNDDVITRNIVCNPVPVRPILLNRGYTTRVEENIFLNALSKIRKQKLLRGRNNTWDTAETKSLPGRLDRYPGFVPFSLEFGCPGAPQPNLDRPPLQTADKPRQIRNRFGKFSTVDEQIRSYTGAPGTDGLYVLRVGLFSPLRRYGVQPEDILLKLGDAPVNGARFAFGQLKKRQVISVFRKSKIQVLSPR